MAALKNSNPSMGDYKDMLIVIEESRTWLSVSEISNISAVSRAKCQILLAQLIESGKVFSKGEGAKLMYANRQVILREKKPVTMDTEFRYAKALFEVHPELLSGRARQPYVAKPYQAQALAMISRRG